MTDSELRAAERVWKASPESEEAIRAALTAFERAGEDPPWALLAASPRWRKVLGFLGEWYARTLGPADGSSAADLAAAEARLGASLPSILREWFLLAGARDDIPQLRQSWSFSDLVGLSQLKADSQGWVDLGWGHQGNGSWGVRLDEGQPQVYAYDGFWQEEGAVDLVGDLEEFYLSFLVEEFTWNGARGGAEGVRYAVYWDLEACLTAAQLNYSRQPVRCLYGGEGDAPRPNVFGDEETLINLNDPEPVYVLTRTPEARERAIGVFGEPPE